MYKSWKLSCPWPRESACIDEETLACFVDNLLDHDDDRSVKLHLAQCEGCMEKVLMAIKINRL